MPSLNADETATLRRYYDNVIGLAYMTRQPIESIPSLATVAENADIRQLIREDRLATARARNGDEVYGGYHMAQRDTLLGLTKIMGIDTRGAQVTMPTRR